MKNHSQGNDKYMKQMPPIFNTKGSSTKMHCEGHMEKSMPAYEPPMMRSEGGMYCYDDTIMKSKSVRNSCDKSMMKSKIKKDCNMYDKPMMKKECDGMYYYDDAMMMRMDGTRDVLPPFEPPMGNGEPEGTLAPFEPPMTNREPEGILPPFEPPLIPVGDQLPPFVLPELPDFDGDDRIERNAIRMISSLEGYYNSLNNAYILSRNEPFEIREEIFGLRNRAYVLYNDAVRIVGQIPQALQVDLRRQPRNYIEALDQASVYGDNAMKYIRNLAFFNYNYAIDVQLLSLYLKLNEDLKILKELLK